MDNFNKFASFFKKHWRMEKFLTILLHYFVKLFHLKPCRMEDNQDNTFKLNIKLNQNKKEISLQKLSSGSASALLISWNIIYGVIYLVRAQNFPKKKVLNEWPLLPMRIRFPPDSSKRKILLCLEMRVTRKIFTRAAANLFFLISLIEFFK